MLRDCQINVSQGFEQENLITPALVYTNTAIDAGAYTRMFWPNGNGTVPTVKTLEGQELEKYDGKDLCAPVCWIQSERGAKAARSLLAAL